VARATIRACSARPRRPDLARRGDRRRGREDRLQAGRHGARRVRRTWETNRFRGPYLRNALWDAGYATDTLETATDWSRAPELAAAVVQALTAGLEGENERVFAFAHLSHVYPSGTAIYVTYVFRQSPRPEGTHRRWLALKTAASRSIVEHGGTISHQHGVGVDHAPYRRREGRAGYRPARDRRPVRPDGLMDPDVLLGRPDATCRRRSHPRDRLRDPEPPGAGRRPARRDRRQGARYVRAVRVRPARLGRAGPGGLVARAG
jgi:FAD/FMN-containing dehydrogenase